MGNLLDTLNNKIKSGLSDHSADFIGEEEDKTRNAVGSTFNALLAGLIEKGKTEKGTRDIHRMVSKVDTRILKDVDQLFTRSPQTVNGLVNIGTRDVPEMMNGKHREAINVIANENEIKRNSTTKIIKLAAPFLLATLNQKATDDKLDAEGLMSYIKGHKGDLSNKISSDMINDLQLSEFGFDSGAIEAEKRRKEEEEAKRKQEAAGKRKENEEKRRKEKEERLAAQSTKVVEETDQSGGGLGWLKWLIPLLLIGLLVGLFGMRGCGDKVASTANNVVTTTTETVGNVAGGAADAVGNVAEKAADVAGNTLGAVSEAGKKALEGIQFAAGSAGSQMMAFIDGGAKGDGRFRFKNLTFNTGSAAISGETGVEVDNLASILNAYPDMKVKVEGYTDSVGDATKNQTLSLNRAESVKNRLLEAGIAEGRIQTQGFGAENPVGDNATAEGRSQNRRIEVVILK